MGRDQTLLKDPRGKAIGWVLVVSLNLETEAMVDCLKTTMIRCGGRESSIQTPQTVSSGAESGPYELPHLTCHTTVFPLQPLLITTLAALSNDPSLANVHCDSS